jgi:hypothetical protein
VRSVEGTLQNEGWYVAVGSGVLFLVYRGHVLILQRPNSLVSQAYRSGTHGYVPSTSELQSGLVARFRDRVGASVVASSGRGLVRESLGRLTARSVVQHKPRSQEKDKSVGEQGPVINQFCVSPPYQGACEAELENVWVEIGWGWTTHHAWRLAAHTAECGDWEQYYPRPGTKREVARAERWGGFETDHRRTFKVPYPRQKLETKRRRSLSTCLASCRSMNRRSLREMKRCWAGQERV